MTFLKLLGMLALAGSVAFTGLSCDKSSSSTASGGGSSSGAGEQVKLVGAGATFPAPLYTQWAKDYHDKNPNVIIEYQGIGSGGGIKQFTAGTTDFGASDVGMSDEQIKAVSGGVTLLPMTAGAIVLSYNIDGVTSLKLSREAYAGIFLGTIKKWNDPKIVESNSGVNLPDKDINVVHRADGSGTTGVFTKHLSAISPEWEKGPGQGVTVNWPVGVGGKGNDGVTALIRQTPDSIGYVEYGYAFLNKLPMAELQNKAGKMVAPTPETAASSLAAVELPADLRAFLPDPAGENSYPIVTYTWMLVHPSYSDAAKGKALKGYILYGLTEGQKISPNLGYIPLPAPVVEKVKAAADSIKVG
jgi:phosphate transport system substrate-binding protein